MRTTILFIIAIASLVAPTRGDETYSRKLFSNRIYCELFGRGMLGIYYDRLLFNYGYSGFGSSIFPPAENTTTGERHGGIWGTIYVGCNTPNFYGNRLFGEVSFHKELYGDAVPKGYFPSYTIGYAFQSVGGFDLQIGLVWGFWSFRSPCFDFGKAF